MGTACTWRVGPVRCPISIDSALRCLFLVLRPNSCSNSTHLVPLSHAIVVLMKSLPLGDLVGAVQARKPGSSLTMSVFGWCRRRRSRSQGRDQVVWTYRICLTAVGRMMGGVESGRGELWCVVVESMAEALRDV